MKKIRVGVVGVGYLGQFHAEKYAAHPEVELVGVVDTDTARASQIADKLKTKSYSTPADLFGQVDAVSIVVPTILHYTIAKQFLDQGIHVLLEKPITTTLEQADELLYLAEKKGAILQIGHIERFNPAYRAVKSKANIPRYITAERAAPFTVRCTDVNVILDLMIHDLDIVSDLAGSEPKEMSAAGASVITNQIDAASARIIFGNGYVADVSASRISDEKKRLLRVYDQESVYTADYQTQKAFLRRKGNPGSEPLAEDISFEKCDTLNEEIRAFIQSVLTGASPLVSGYDGRRSLCLALTITRIIEQGIFGFVPLDKA
ncbi:MAG: Gfo/Idh/MocA family oxidoreductase [Nitrospirota bacterium]